MAAAATTTTTTGRTATNAPPPPPPTQSSSFSSSFSSSSSPAANAAAAAAAGPGPESSSSGGGGGIMDVEDILAPGDAAGGAVACLRPCVARYGPSNQRLHMGETKLWCTCGLSKKQPWCDGSHVGTGFKPLKWTVSVGAGAKPQKYGGGGGGAAESSSAATGPPPPGFFSLCNCKYTKMPPFCDGEHIHLPLRYHEAIEACTEDHSAPALRLCTNCGYARPLPPSPTASRA